MKRHFLPGADRTQWVPPAPEWRYRPRVFKIVCHATETLDWPLYAQGGAPTFSVMLRGSHAAIRQHMPIGVCSRPEQHWDKYVEVSVVGTADPSMPGLYVPTAPSAVHRALGQITDFLAEHWGLVPVEHDEDALWSLKVTRRSSPQLDREMRERFTA